MPEAGSLRVIPALSRLPCGRMGTTCSVESTSTADNLKRYFPAMLGAGATATVTQSVQSMAGAEMICETPSSSTVLDDPLERLKPGINESFMLTGRLLKAAFTELARTAVQLKQAKELLGDGFESWVETHTACTPAAANSILRFASEHPLDEKLFSPAVAADPQMLLTRLEMLWHSKMEPPKSRPKRRQAAKRPTPATQPPPRSSKPKSTAADTPVPQTGLTKQERQLIRDHSAKLYAQVATGRLSGEEALRIVRGSAADASPSTSTGE